jgi:hypothetical protein
MRSISGSGSKRFGCGLTYGRSLIWLGWPQNPTDFLMSVNIRRDRRGEIAAKMMGVNRMPFDAVLLSLAVIVVFLGFAGTLAWADRQTRSPRDPDLPTPKRRSF